MDFPPAARRALWSGVSSQLRMRVSCKAHIIYTLVARLLRRLKLKFIISKIDQFIRWMLGLYLHPGGSGSAYLSLCGFSPPVAAPPGASVRGPFCPILLRGHPDDLESPGRHS